MKVDLLVHVVAGDQVGFDGRQAPPLDEHAAVLPHAQCTDDAGAVEAPNLSAGVGLVANHVVHPVNVKLAAHDFLHESRNGLTVVFVLPVHQGKQTAKAFLTEDVSDRLTDGGVGRLEDGATPRLVGAEGGVNPRGFEQMRIGRMADVVEQGSELNEFLIRFGEEAGMDLVEVGGQFAGEVVGAQRVGEAIVGGGREHVLAR